MLQRYTLTAEHSVEHAETEVQLLMSLGPLSSNGLIPKNTSIGYSYCFNWNYFRFDLLCIHSRACTNINAKSSLCLTPEASILMKAIYGFQERLFQNHITSERTETKACGVSPGFMMLFNSATFT